MWDDLVRQWRLMAESRTWSSSFPISALLAQPGQYGEYSQPGPTLELFCSSRCQRFPLAPRLAWPEPDVLSPCCPHLTLPLLTVLCVLWQSSAPLWPKFSPKRAFISCYYQQLPKLYLSSLRAFIQLTPPKSQPLVLTLLAHVQLFPVSCRSAVLKSQRASPLAFLTYYTRPARPPSGFPMAQWGRIGVTQTRLITEASELKLSF